MDKTVTLFVFLGILTVITLSSFVMIIICLVNVSFKNPVLIHPRAADLDSKSPSVIASGITAIILGPGSTDTSGSIFITSSPTFSRITVHFGSPFLYQPGAVIVTQAGANTSSYDLRVESVTTDSFIVSGNFPITSTTLVLYYMVL